LYNIYVRIKKEMGIFMMNEKEFQLLKLQNRLARLKGTEKNIKSPGVVRKLTRQIYKLKQSLAET
jgi:hypothetical protein